MTNNESDVEMCKVICGMVVAAVLSITGSCAVSDIFGSQPKIRHEYLYHSCYAYGCDAPAAYCGRHHEVPK